ncbi:MAG: fibronectin type III domain-containing protein [Verrucomicrobiaceae bacterium]|nr:fibronectin type III domain-containing protein [Verrucomicrobiaceae bacterium]
MRPVRWDDGTLWDDLNAYWGSDTTPAYVLEPGDPGYRIPPPPPGSNSPANANHRHTMSSNATPKNRVILLSVAHNIHAGQLTHAGSVGLLRHLAPAMDAAIKKLEGDPDAAPGSAANKGSQLLFRECVNATGAAEKALTTLSDGPVKTWLEGYHKAISSVHGKKPNDGWVAAGFEPGSTAIPRNHEARHTLLAAARAYLAAHPSYETSLPQAEGPPLAVTAAQALVLHGQVLAAKTLINTRGAEQEQCKNARDADEDALYEEVSDTIAELRDALGDTDPRWEIFGLNIPASPNPPLGVSSLTVTSAGTGRELLSWPYAVRAEYYRVFLKRVGIDADFINVADPKDLEYTAKDLPAGTTIEAYVVPMNDGGAGPASPTVTKVVGA